MGRGGGAPAGTAGGARGVLLADLVGGEPHELVGEDEPGVGLLEVEVGLEGPAAAGGLVVERGEAEVLHERPERLLHGGDRVAAVEDVVDDEDALGVAEVVEDGAEVLDDGVLVLADAGVGLGLDGGVVAVDAEVVEELLDGDGDGRAAAPEADDDVGPEAGVVDLAGGGEAVAGEAVGVEVDLVAHGGGGKGG